MRPHFLALNDYVEVESDVWQQLLTEGFYDLRDGFHCQQSNFLKKFGQIRNTRNFKSSNETKTTKQADHSVVRKIIEKRVRA